MALTVFRTSLFDKQLEELRKADKKGTLAAERAQEIFQNILQQGWSFLELKNKLTKHGELRLKSCRKYDLGSGYRLICLKKGDELFFLYVGSHADCDRWLNKKRGGSLNLELESDGISLEVEEVADEHLADAALNEEVDEYEEELAAKLDDKILRSIFQGICNS